MKNKFLSGFNGMMFWGLMTMILFPIRLLLITIFSDNIYATVGSLTIVSLILIYFSRKGKLGWFGRIFIKSIERMLQRRSRKITFFFAFLSITSLLFYIISVNYGETFSKTEIDQIKQSYEEKGMKLNYQTVVNQAKQMDARDWAYATFLTIIMAFVRFDLFSALMATVNDMTGHIYLNMAYVLAIEQAEVIGMMFLYRKIFGNSAQNINDIVFMNPPYTKVENYMKQEQLKFKPKLDKTMMILLIGLMFVIGVTIGQAILSSKAHGIESYNIGKLTTGTVLGNPNMVTVKLSNTCEALVKNNQTDDCPSYKTLMKVDTSNQRISGKIVIDKNGYTHRLDSKSINSARMYRTDQLVTIIDPDIYSLYYAKNIEIVPHGTLLYATNDEQIKNTTRIQYHSRYVDQQCKDAKIEFSWELLNDTISYLQSGCKTTNYHEAQKVNMTQHGFVFDNQFSSLWYKNQIKNLMKDSNKFTQNCINHKCPYSDPYKKKGY